MQQNCIFLNLPHYAINRVICNMTVKVFSLNASQRLKNMIFYTCNCCSCHMVVLCVQARSLFSAATYTLLWETGVFLRMFFKNILSDCAKQVGFDIRVLFELAFFIRHIHVICCFCKFVLKTTTCWHLFSILLKAPLRTKRKNKGGCCDIKPSPAFYKSTFYTIGRVAPFFFLKGGPHKTINLLK